MNFALRLAAPAALLAAAAAMPAQAAIIGVSGPNSNRNVAAQIINAPTFATDAQVTNQAQQGFNEQQNVVLANPLNIDGPAVIDANTRVDSHMIFLNREGGGDTLRHGGVVWTFSGNILGVMSDRNGTAEFASTSFLGASNTIYQQPSLNGTFNARGLESNNGTGLGNNDGYEIIAPNQIRVSMEVTQPGDWIRVVTATPIPVPAALPLFLAALAGLGFMARRRVTAA